MGDAVRGGDVQAAELEDTIDAAPGAEPAPARSPVVVAATRDHQELAPVERHHYAITREIARGGIGRVFEARDLRLGRQVAIKELQPKNRDAARRFEREARITARLQHPAIIHVYEAGVWPGGEPFYAMPLVPGRSLDKVVAEKKTLAERLGLLPNVIAVADALAYAHNANVIHRDLKPANVLVGEFGETVVIDWGLAKDLGVHSDPKESLQLRLRTTAEETVSGAVVGTPAYMPPEQARGDAVDQRADVYALGALLYKVLAGEAPYSGPSSRDVLEQVKAGPPVPVQDRVPDAPADLVAIVAKAMAHDPRGRYGAAGELAADLKRFETGQLVGAHRYTVGDLVRRWLRRHRVAVAIGAFATVALIVIGVFSVQRIIREKRLADARRANLLEERGRTELLAGHAGAALAYLVGAAEHGQVGGARGFLIADAMRPFEAAEAHIDVGGGGVAIAVSRDGRYVAVGGEHRIAIRAGTGGPEQDLGSFGVTHALAFDANATKLVAAGADGAARVWTLSPARPPALLATLKSHEGAVLDAVFTPDGDQVITAGADATVQVWDLATQTSRVVSCHVGAVTSVRVSPDGARVLTASEDSTACIITLSYEQPISPAVHRQLRGHTAAVNRAVWSADGALVVTASSDGTARVWDADTGKPVVESLRHEPGSIVQVAAMTSDGLIVTGGNDLVLRVWTLPSTLAEPGTAPPAVKPARKLVGHTARIVAIGVSADERHVVTGGFDGLAKVWDLESGQEISTFEHGDVVNAVAFVPNVSKLASGSRDGAARIWSTKAVDAPPDFDSAINALAIADGAVAVGLADSMVRVVRDTSHSSCGNKQDIELHGHLDSVHALAFTPDGTILVSAGEDASAIVWSTTSCAKLRTLGEHNRPTRALAIGNDSQRDADRVVMLVGGTVEVWEISTGRLVRVLGADKDNLDAIAINPKTGAIAGVGRDGTIIVWDAATWRTVWQQRDLATPYTAVAFSPDGTALVTAGMGVAHVWPLRGDRVDAAQVVTLETGTGGIGIVRAVVVTADGSRVITGGDNGRAMIWDRAKGKLLATRDRHDKAITSLALRDDRLWIGSADHSLTSWDVRVEAGTVPALKTFMAKMRVPVMLDDNDVLRKAR